MHRMLGQERNIRHAHPMQAEGFVEADGTPVLVTVHPSWVLRQPAGAARDAAFRELADDLAKLLPAPGRPDPP